MKKFLNAFKTFTLAPDKPINKTPPVQTEKVNFDDIYMNQKWMDEFYLLAKTTFSNILKQEKIENDKLATVLAMDSLKAINKSKTNIKHQFETTIFFPENTEVQKSKNILFVTSIFPSVLHGGGMRVFDMMYELAQRDYNVYLYTMDHNVDEYSKKSLQEFCKKITLTSPHQFNKPELLKWAKSSAESFLSTYYVWPSASDLIVNAPDVFGQNIFEFIECTTLRLWMDIKQLLIENKPISSEILSGFWRDYFCESQAIAKCKKFICVTQKDKEFVNLIHQSEPKDFHVLSTGISQTEIINKLESFNLDEVPLSAGFIGNYAHYPNLDGLHWYFKNIHKKIADSISGYQFYVFGIGEISDLKEKYSHFNSSVKWVGPIDCVVESLLPIKLMLCPLISGAGLRGKVIQYASLKKPIVSTAIGAEGTPFKNGEDIFISDTPEQFADYAIEILQNNNKANELADNANKLARSYYGWKAHIDQLEAIL